VHLCPHSECDQVSSPLLRNRLCHACLSWLGHIRLDINVSMLERASTTFSIYTDKNEGIEEVWNDSFGMFGCLEDPLFTCCLCCNYM